MEDREDLAGWLRLLETPHVGPGTARRLLAAFGGPQAVLEASATALRDVAGAAVAASLAEEPSGFADLLARTSAWLAQKDGAPRDVIALGDDRYPARLLQTADPPLLLYALGRVELLAAPSIAIVGSRNPTPQGLENARDFARSLSDAGLTVVSGLALGVDGAAHDGALRGPGSTVAVVGTGLDRIYPKRHLALAHRIAAEGLLLSEFALGTPPLADHFPRRNRIIAGLTHGTLVVEAALQSGSLITARLANEAGREVFAIPGSIHAPQARGCHALIKQGAKLVESAADVLDELSFDRDAPSSPPVAKEASDETDALLVALGHDPVTLDALSARTGWAPAAMSARLLDLELAGKVARLPGQLFQRLVRS